MKPLPAASLGTFPRMRIKSLKGSGYFTMHEPYFSKRNSGLAASHPYCAVLTQHGMHIWT